MTTTKNIVVMRTNKQDYFLYLATTDGTEAEIKAMDNSGAETGKSIGDKFPNETVQEIEVFSATPSNLDKIAVKDNTGGIIFEAQGAITAAEFPAPNFVMKGLSVPIKKGYTSTILTAD
jgi:hypothetical protein